MDTTGKILFWFREPDLMDGDLEVWPSIVDCEEFIPIFCFDPREGQLEPSINFHLQMAGSVHKLRDKLQKRGSNLLVVYHYYESIIPSIARVLNVNRVVSHNMLKHDSSIPEQIFHFREKKLSEVRHLLNMHSIPLEIEILKSVQVPDVLPAFPSINPGVIKI